MLHTTTVCEPHTTDRYHLLVYPWKHQNLDTPYYHKISPQNNLYNCKMCKKLKKISEETSQNKEKQMHTLATSFLNAQPT